MQPPAPARDAGVPTWRRLRRRTRLGAFVVAAWLMAIGLAVAALAALIVGGVSLWPVVPVTIAAAVAVAIVALARPPMAVPVPGRERFRRAAWRGVFVAGVAYALALALSAGTLAVPAGSSVRLEYEATLIPSEAGPYRVILPATAATQAPDVVAGDARVERVERLHGEGWSVRAAGPVTLRGDWRERQGGSGVGATAPTLLAPEPEAPWRPEFWIYASAPVAVTMGLNASVSCGTHAYLVDAALAPGWRRYPGAYEGLHGDLCATDLLFLPVAILVLPVLALAPLVFVGGLVAMSGAEVWWRVRRRRP